MLATSERERPHIARARVVSSRGSKRISPSCKATEISSATVQASAPLGPFTWTVWPSTSTITPAGTGIAFLPMRDMSIDPKEDLAPHVGLARGVVAHHALGRREDRDAKPVLHRLQVRDGAVDTPARLRDAADLGDHRLTLVV